MSERRLKFDTLQVHAGQTADPTTGSRAVPIYQTTSYEFKNVQHAADLFALKESGNIYTRIMNPTTDVLSSGWPYWKAVGGRLLHRLSSYYLCDLEYSVRRHEIVSASTLYGGTYNLFAHTFKTFGIKVNFVDQTIRKFRRAIMDKPRQST